VNRILALSLCMLPGGFSLAAELPKPLASGMKNPESVCLQNGRVFVTSIGEFDKNDDGGVYEIIKGQPKVLAGGMNDPKGIVGFQGFLYVTDKTVIRRVEIMTGKSEILVEEADFPKKPTFLNDIEVDERGALYVSDSGDLQGGGGAIYKVVRPFNRKGAAPGKSTVTLVADQKSQPWLKSPNGIVMDSMFHLLVVDFFTGELHRLRVSDMKAEKVAEGFPGGDGLCFDHYGRLYITSWKEGKLWSIPRPGEKPILMAEKMEQAADICYDPIRRAVLIPDMKVGTLLPIPAQPKGWEIDETPLPFGVEVAFSKMKWTGWESGEETGKVVPLRPLVITAPNDGSNRTFMATQHGVIHSFDKNGASTQSNIFLDMQKKVLYNDNENEQGLLGMAFSPKYKTDGEFYVFYTDKTKRLQNVLSRFRVSKTDPNKADPDSEEQLLRISHKFWNHDGGTVCFGADGYLYLVLGDGGLANDPDDNAQNLTNLLGKILRLDVSKKGDSKPYAIPADNPFVNSKNAQPEIYAYGVRNPWRLSFDRETGLGWFADVGQNLWEEINILQNGGNYGWRRREGLHPFWNDGHGPVKEMVEPAMEYHHEVGKSITGGHVYRGKKYPELQGYYLYADYVTGKVWGMKYDHEKKRVVANRPIQDKNLPIMSFGEDQDGEIYLMTYSATGKGIFQIVPLAK
jgi:glucose/arabinose dehydrogenase